MDLMQSTSPNFAQITRRRKKRFTPIGSTVPGSSLSGLNRNSIRVVELQRGNVGYGFTISGQKPCLLRCIVESSPAERAFLRPGNCLVGVNGKDVSHLAHDEVVALIGKCTGLLRLHVADSYFSESSDEESLQVHQPRPKYHNRVRAASKTSLSKKLSAQAINKHERQDSISSDKMIMTSENTIKCTSESTTPNFSPNLRRRSCDTMMNSPRRVPSLPLVLGEESPVPALPSRNPKMINPNVESVRVFTNLDNRINNNTKSEMCSSNTILVDDGKNFNKPNFASKKTVMNCNPSPGSNSNSSIGADCLSIPGSALYQAVVGYVGSVELPVIEEKKRLQALSACVRRLRIERRMRSIVLLRIHSSGISLFSSNQNVQTGPPLAFYSSRIISFCGAYSEDRRFFGLVTCTSPTKNCSCHVFMVEPKLLSHLDHSRRARAFGIQCTLLPLPKNGQVLGLQECVEFPATADPILSSILRLHCSGEQQPTQRSPSEASTRLESTNSSNSDSGIGFRDDSDRNSARIYDIVEPELLFDVKNIRRSPIPRRKYPHSQRKVTPLPFSTCQQSCVECQEESNSDTKSRSTNSLPVSISSSFQSDPHALREILYHREDSIRDELNRRVSNRRGTNSEHFFRHPTPPHIEVSVVVTPTQAATKEFSVDEVAKLENDYIELESGFKTPLARHGTRSLDNLCSPEIFSQPVMESKGNMGSTPALNQEPAKSSTAEEFWEFKVPQPPKPKMEMNRVETWAETIEKLLADHCGREIFTEFLQHEFSAENILFYNDCIRFKESYKNLTQSQRISMASTIFQRYLQNGATDPVNVDFQARSQVEKLLSQPTADVFDLPLGQVFNLLKFDCYPRFLRSEMYRDYSSGAVPLPQYCDETSDSDQDSVKSHKLEHDGRRRSLLPWNIKNRSKKSKSKGETERLNSDISFIQRTAMNQNTESSDTDDGRRQSYKLCRVLLPDNSTTVLPCKPGETLSTVVQRLLEKREFNYSAFEVISVATGKALDLTQEVSEMSAKEIRVEPRAFIGIELPRGWRVGVRANPSRKISEVLKPILSQHDLKIDAVVVYDIETDEMVDVKRQMGRVDGHNLLVKLKDAKLEEITNHVQELGGMDDDEVSNKTSSSQTSSVFRGFLRRSSKKYKRKGKNNPPSNEFCDEPTSDRVPTQTGNDSYSVASHLQHPHPSNYNMSIVHDENSQPHQRLKAQLLANESSPLSLVSSELKLAENSRNRKPIYIGQMSNPDS